METTTNDTSVAEPLPGTVRDAYGDPCLRATDDSWPLRSTCYTCGAEIRCADGTASWHHRRTGQATCRG